MHDYSYSAHLVINDGYEDRLDMTITCQNAQQLLRAKDLIADQMNAYIAEFAVQSGLTGVPSNAEQNAAALQAVIQEQTEKAKQQEPEEPAEPEPPETAPDEPEESPPIARRYARCRLLPPGSRIIQTCTHRNFPKGSGTRRSKRLDEAEMPEVRRCVCCFHKGLPHRVDLQSMWRKILAGKYRAV